MRTIFILLGLVLLLTTPPAWAFTSQDYYNSGVNFYQQKRYEKAVIYLKEAVRLDPQNWQAYQMLGTSYYQTGDEADAAGAIQTSLKIHPDNPALAKFADQFNLPAAAPVSTPLASIAMGVKPAATPGSKAQHIFFNIGLSFEEPFGGSLSSAEKAYKSQPSPGPGYTNTNQYEPEIFGFSLELGYDLDKENGLSLCLYPPAADSGPSLWVGNSNETTGDFANESISATVNVYGLRYYRYLPDNWGRWFGFVSADYYSLSVDYWVNQGSGLSPTNNGSAMSALELSGSTLGGSLGVGRQLDIFGFLSLEASIAFKYADVPQVKGSYTSSTTTNNATSPGPSGQGTLVTLSNGSVILVDQKNVGTSKVTNFDLSGLEGRAVLNIWL